MYKNIFEPKTTLFFIYCPFYITKFQVFLGIATSPHPHLCFMRHQFLPVIEPSWLVHSNDAHVMFRKPRLLFH